MCQFIPNSPRPNKGLSLQSDASILYTIPMPSESDRLIVQQIRQGDAHAWDQLIARYEGRLLAFVNRRLHDRPASEDVVQETFVGFLNSLPNYDEGRELQTYLFTIA